MGYGYTGKILDVNLTEGKISTIEMDETFYRTYLGGAGIALYFALREIPAGIDPLSPENVIVFAPGLITGTTSPAMPRYTVCAKSPLTGAIGKSEAGGFWGPEVKKAGYDAIIVRGKSANPVYLNLSDEVCELKSAESVWGKDTQETQRALLEAEGPKTKVLQIGPGSENMVFFGNIVNELGHFNGRNGLGAVMGSKNLKAITAKGTKGVSSFNEDAPKTLAKWVAQNMKDHSPAYGLYKNGTAGGITGVNANGALPTRNWQESVFEHAQDISAEKLEEILIQRKGCYSCPIRCKRVVQSKDPAMPIDPELGGPEYEALICLGSNLGIGNIKLISKANELCNRYTMDYITLGMTISFAMECYAKGFLTIEDTGGVEMSFGNEAILLDLIKLTAKREGVGALLALGSYRLSEKLGPQTEDFLLQVKKQELPAHDPRSKSGLGLQLALSSYGADHWVAQHDPFYTEKGSDGLKSVEVLGIYDPVPIHDLSSAKVKLFYYTHMMTMMYDCLGACVFGYATRSIVSLEQLVQLTQDVTGWKVSLWDLLKAGERVSIMLRAFNQREGFSAKDDVLPKRVHGPIANGPRTGQTFDEEAFLEARNLYYEMAGLDQEGHPQKSKLLELNLEWLLS